MQVPILSGNYADTSGAFRTAYPRNQVPTPKDTSISRGYLRAADGIATEAEGPGINRGGINWRGKHYRVMGSKLVRIDGSAVVILGEVGNGGWVSMDYSFDVLGIASGGNLYYWDGSTLTQLSDPDAGTVLDVKWIAGYWLLCDGTYIAVTELNDRYSVNPLKYGSAEAKPDPINAIDELRNEAYAFGRYTVEVFENVGGSNFPFQVIKGALVERGCVGVHAYAPFAETFAMLGSGQNEAPGIWLVGGGASAKLSTAEVDQILLGYSEADLSLAVMETRIDKGHEHLMLHLTDRCLVYDAAASKAVGEAIWFMLDSSIVGFEQYRGKGLVWVHDAWFVGDTKTSKIGRLDEGTDTHFGDVIGWDFGTTILYNKGGAIVYDIELICLPGRVPLGADPTVWTSYSIDGETWSQEKPISAGKTGQRNKRLVWFDQGSFENWRIQRFRGTSHLSMARLEVTIEPLNG